MMVSIILLFAGAISVALIHGWLGKMPNLNLPLGRGWNGINTESYVSIPLEIGICLALAFIPYVRWFGIGVIFYYSVSVCAAGAHALSKRRKKMSEKAYPKPRLSGNY